MTEHETDRAQGRRQGPGAGPRLAEWVTFGLGLLIVLGVAGYLAYQAAGGDRPYLEAQVQPLMGEVRQVGGRYLLPVEVRNRGDRTISQFRAEVTLGTGDSRQRREIQIDFLGERSSQKVYLYFEQDPSRQELQAAPHSYQVE